MSAIERIGSKQVYANAWLRLREDEIEYADGTRGIYTVVEKPDFALVIPYADRGFWLVEQYRYPVSSREWEFPQGGWTAGATGTPVELAAAELAEETGFRASRLEQLGRLYASYGFSSQAYDVYLATDLVAGVPDREDSEADMVAAWFADDEVRAMIGGGELRDAHSVAALTLFDLVRRPSGA